MTKIDNQLKQLIIRKCGLVCVIFVFTLLSFYTQDNVKSKKQSQSKDSFHPDLNSNEENSFYFLTSDLQRENGLGEIDQKVINPLNFKVQNVIREDQSLLRSNLRKKFSNRVDKRFESKLADKLNDAKIKLGDNFKNERVKRQLKGKKERKLTSTKNRVRLIDTKSRKNKNFNKNFNKKQQRSKQSLLRRKRNDEDDEEEEENTKKKSETKKPDDEEEEETIDRKAKGSDNGEEEEVNEKAEEEEHEKENEKENEKEEETEKEKEKVNEKEVERESAKDEKIEGETPEARRRRVKLHELKGRKLTLNKDNEVCTPNSAKEFPPDLFGHKLRAKGFIIIHIFVTCYMFFCLALVCDQYFLPSLELCSSKLGLSNDVAGATFMAAGSSAPELFAAILGVFIAKSDVGTGTIVGSAIFNILFVIGLCGVCAASVQLTWWPVARDSSYYCLTVFVLIVVAFDGQVSTLESSFMLLLYVGYIVVMHFNVPIYNFVLAKINLYTSSEFSDKIMNMDNSTQNKLGKGMASYRSFQEEAYSLPNVTNTLPPSQHLNKISMFEAANHVIIQHSRLFRPLTRFRAAGDLIVIQNRKFKIARYQSNNLGSLSRQESVISYSKRKISIAEDVEEYWRTIPNYAEQGLLMYAKWYCVAPLYSVLYYTVPNCKKNQSLFLATFLVSIVWIALFSYLMVWMVTLIGYTFGIPDAIMGITLLAAGTSVPDAYTSLHVAKQGMGDMAVSNSIGSNVFDILVGLALPFFIETTIVYPGANAVINSKGLFYAMCLLFLSLVVTVYLFYANHWVLNKQLGILMIISYFVILLFCGILEFNIIDVKNPVPCDD